MRKRSTRNCSSSAGLSLIELTIAMALTLLLTGAALSLAFTSRRLYDSDSARVVLNQSMRASQDFLVTDIRQAGERLGPDFPALELINGASGAADVLILRRNLIDTVLRSCEDVSGTVGQLFAEAAGGLPGCSPFPDADADDWADHHQIWRDRRLAAGGSIVAFLYNPRTGHGEFFPYVGDDATAVRIDVAAGHIWTHVYPADDLARIYLLEERRYELNDHLMQLTINGDTRNPVNLVDHIDDMQTIALFRDGSSRVTLDFHDDWSDLKAVRVTVRGSVEHRGRTVSRNWTNEILPRNILSR